MKENVYRKIANDPGQPLEDRFRSLQVYARELESNLKWCRGRLSVRNRRLLLVWGAACSFVVLLLGGGHLVIGPGHDGLVVRFILVGMVIAIALFATVAY